MPGRPTECVKLKAEPVAHNLTHPMRLCATAPASTVETSHCSSDRMLAPIRSGCVQRHQFLGFRVDKSLSL